MKKWEDDECAKRVVTAESPELSNDEEWTIELLELYVKAKEYVVDSVEVSLYYWKEVRLRNEEHVIFLVRTRVDQLVPGSRYRVDILERSVKVGGNYIPGEKVYFHWAHWRNIRDKIDWANLPAYNTMSQYDEKVYVPNHQLSFHPVQHMGSCGYMALAQALGLSSWKKIFQKLVDADYFKCNVTIPDDDSLDSKYWLNVETRKSSCYFVCYLL